MCRTVLSLAGGVGGFSVTKRSPASAGSLKAAAPSAGQGRPAAFACVAGEWWLGSVNSPLEHVEEVGHANLPQRDQTNPPPIPGSARRRPRFGCSARLRAQPSWRAEEGAAGWHRPLRRGVLVLVREIEAVPRRPHLPQPHKAGHATGHAAGQAASHANARPLEPQGSRGSESESESERSGEAATLRFLGISAGSRWRYTSLSAYGTPCANTRAHTHTSAPTSQTR